MGLALHVVHAADAKDALSPVDSDGPFGVVLGNLLSDESILYSLYVHNFSLSIRVLAD